MCLGSLGKPPNPSQFTIFFLLWTGFIVDRQLFFLWTALTSNRHRTDKQTRGILGKPSNPAQLTTFFWLWTGFIVIYWQHVFGLWTVIVQTATYRQTETAFYNIDYENVRKIRSIGYCKRSICPEITFKTLSELLAKNCYLYLLKCKLFAVFA